MSMDSNWTLPVFAILFSSFLSFWCGPVVFYIEVSKLVIWSPNFVRFCYVSILGLDSSRELYPV